MSQKLRFSIIAILILGGVLIFSQTSLASEFIRAVNPGDIHDTAAIVPPALIPPASNSSEQNIQPADGEILAPDERPVAQIADPPKEIAGSTYVDFPDTANIVEEDVGYVILANITYSGEKGTVAVSTSRPTLAASALPVALGDQEIKLSDGTTAWLTMQGSGDLPNRVVFVRDNIIITIAGNLSVDEILSLAEQIAIK
jgi:hypothetical protein